MGEDIKIDQTWENQNEEVQAIVSVPQDDVKTAVRSLINWHGVVFVLKAGIPHHDPAALQLAQEIWETAGVELTGIYAHCGNTYGCEGVEQIKDVAQNTTTFTLEFMEKYAHFKTHTKCHVMIQKNVSLECIILL